MPARLALLTAVVLGVIACGPGGRAASNAPASRTCRNADEESYLNDQQTCLGGRLVKLVMDGPAPAATPIPMPAPDSLPPGSRTITYSPAADLGEHSAQIAVGPDALWLVGQGLWRVNAAGRVARVAGVATDTTDVSFAAGSLWIGSEQDSVTRLDLTGRVLATVALPPGSLALGVFDAFNSVWVVEHHLGSLARVDPGTNKVAGSVHVAFLGLDGAKELAAVDGSLWVAIPNVNAVLRIDPARDEIVGSIPFPKENSGPCGLTATSGTLWERSCDNNLLSRIDPATNRITRSFDLGGSPSDGAAAGDTLWIAVGGDDNHPTAPAFLLHLRDDGTVLQRYALGNGFRPGAVALAFGAIWVTDEMRPLLMRIPNPA